MRRKNVWRVCCACSVALCIVAFTPLVIPAGISKPLVFGMPRTLWTGLLVSLGLMIITIVGAWAANVTEKGADK